MSCVCREGACALCHRSCCPGELDVVDVGLDAGVPVCRRCLVHLEERVEARHAAARLHLLDVPMPWELAFVPAVHGLAGGAS